MTDIKLKILTEKDFLFLAKKNPEGIYDEETRKDLDRIIKRLIRGKQFCTGDEKQLLKKFQDVIFGILLRKDTETKGKINHPGTVQVLGNFTGDLAAESVFIEKTATVLANIAAEEVLCKGKVRGDIRATNKVKITKEAEVTGDIYSPNLNIEKGALFEGRCSMPKNRTP
ncbi:MAG: cytoskeletal protein CcmA (bactofilin family) [Nitrospinales bacterium]|jgi:cytoskeletal protein CcmA (bactofilin family)